MKNIAWKVVLILVIVALCLWSLFPVDQKIRLGKDLRGGTSLVYLVNLPEGTPNKAEVISQTIEVLKERVNPQGVLDISMNPLGEDRIEVVMPLPSDKVKALRAAYEKELASLLAMAEISISDLDQALRADRAPAMIGGASGRAEQVEALQTAYNNWQAAKAALVEGRNAGAEGAALIALEQAVVNARVAYEEARGKVLNSSLDEARINRTLAMSDEPQRLRDAQNKVVRDEQGHPKEGPSQRALALTAIKTQFPHLAEQLDKTVAAYDHYQKERTSLDDPEDLIRLMRGAGVLEFRIAVQPDSAEGVNVQDMRRQLQEQGPEKTDSTVAAWFPINDLKQWYDEPADLETLEANPQAYFASRYRLVGDRHEDRYYVLLYTTPAKAMTHTADSRWAIERAGPAQDQLGRPAVMFRLDASGGNLMGRLTGPHVQQPMAIVLDGQVYSAPNLNSAISGNGVIEGQFTEAEIEYLIRVLAAGSLEARLSDEPIAMNTLGPSLGYDNLVRGEAAFIISLIITAAIMIGYYFFAGFIACVALLINALIIFGTMAMIDGTFTLPGIAGIALSIAMAVDANVLIYERIREEVVNNKEDLRTAIRLGYSRAMNAIIDGNVTHLITCIVLMYTATTEVKGFALTMILGVLATLFTALFVTRVLFTYYTEYFHIRKLPMLPTVFPGIHRALEPNFNWLAKRGVFFTASIVVSILCIALVFMRGPEMLDTEFRGGLALTMQTRQAQPGEPKDAQGRLVLSRPEVEQRVQAIGDAAGPANPTLHQLRNASVLTVGESTADFLASRFQIKVASPPTTQDEATITNEIVGAVVKELGPQLDVEPAHAFQGAGEAAHQAHTFPIEDASLGANIGRPELEQSVEAFKGGVIVVVEDISPPISTQAAADRLTKFRNKTAFADMRGRKAEVFGLDAANPGDPAGGFTSIAIAVYDKGLDQASVDVDLWDRDLAAAEWRLASTALSTGSSFQEISSFSPAMAETLTANAVVAVVLSLLGMLMYIWIRFGSLRYSVSTIVAVTHNVIVCLGALALTQYVAGTRVASWLMLEEFRIDLNVIAALLTIIGYSLNDTIVILDRIRENRGKRLFATPEIVNTSINQTFSRTILTGGSTILASVVLYVLGGTGIQPFAFTFLVGLLVGTYSSVAIAAPLVVGGPGSEGGANPAVLDRLANKPGALAAST